MTRSIALQEFIDSLAGAFAVANAGRETTSAVGKIFSGLAQRLPAGNVSPNRLAVCDYVAEALNSASTSTPQVLRLANAFAVIEPALHWAVRHSSGPHASENWPEGHANATIIGRGGLEPRDDFAIGVSLLAPHVRYPDHTHTPEEVYLVMTPGRFQHGTSDWFSPGPGGTLHNVPNIKHAMASDDGPLLAFWCLLL